MAEIVVRLSDKAQRVFVACTVGAILLSVLLALWRSDAFSPKYRLRVYTSDAGSLNAMTQVKLDGIPVGSVRSINVAADSASAERRIEIDLRIEKRFQQAIRTDSTATVKSDGVLAEPYVNIQRGFKGTIIAPDGEIQFVPMPAFRDVNFHDLFEKIANCIQPPKDSQARKDRGSPDIPADARR